MLINNSFVTAQVQAVPSTENPFLGIWEWQNGNQIFRVTLFEQNKTTKGHFQMLEINQNSNGVNTATVLYTSDKPYNSAMTEHWHPVINAGLEWNRDDVLSGRILDNSMNYEAPEFASYDFWHAWLEMKIIQSNCSNCQLTARWKVRYKDLTPSNAMPLNIPTDIIMIKIN
jgi:hypothetical protein